MVPRMRIVDVVGGWACVRERESHGSIYIGERPLACTLRLFRLDFNVLEVHPYSHLSPILPFLSVTSSS